MSMTIVPVSSLTNINMTSEVEGLEGQTIKPSKIILVHPMTKGAGDTLKIGKLADTLTSQNFDSLTVVPLAIRPGRVLFPAGQNAGGTPLCRSNDGKFPAPNVPEKQSNSCATCAHGPKLWTTYKRTGIKPDCKENFNMLFIDRESGFPYYMTIGGTSITPFRQIQQAVYRDILMQRAKGNDFKLHDYTFEIRPMAVQGAKGSYHVLNFINMKRIANPGEYGPLYDMFVKSTENVFKEEETEAVIDTEFSDVEVQYESPIRRGSYQEA